MYRKVRIKTIMLMTAAVLTVLSPAAMAQKTVSDKNNQNQLASMEFKQWKFTPEKYYYSWYWQKLIFFKIKLPGLGIYDNGLGGIGFITFHKHYVDERWRQMTPLRLGTAAETALEQGSRTETTDLWTGLAVKDAIELADNMLDLTGSYSTAKKRLERCRERIATLTALTDEQKSMAEDDLLLIRQSIDDLDKSGMGSARRMEGYQKETRHMEQVEDKYYRINMRNLFTLISDSRH